MESHLEGEHPGQKLVLLLSFGKHSSSEDKPLFLIHANIIPFQSFPMAWPTGSQVEGTPGLLQDHPQRRYQWETGQLSLATETWPPILPQIPSKLPLIRI